MVNSSRCWGWIARATGHLDANCNKLFQTVNSFVTKTDHLEHATFAIASSAVASFVLAKVLVFTADRHGRFTMDLPGAVQKFHSKPTPRIGGIGIYLALIVAWRIVPEPDAAGMLATILRKSVV